MKGHLNDFTVEWFALFEKAWAAREPRIVIDAQVRPIVAEASKNCKHERFEPPSVPQF